MKREIKFRGKSTETGKWLYGCLLLIDGRKPHILCGPGAAEVDPDTVGQFTGLQDENGVDVYEGDLVQCKSFPRKTETINVIMWGFRGFEQWSAYDVEHPDEAESWWTYTFTVVGNIHDNPDLLKK